MLTDWYKMCRYFVRTELMFGQEKENMAKNVQNRHIEVYDELVHTC